MEREDKRKLDIYFGKITDEVITDKVLPKEREDEINATKDPLLKIQKYCVWKLLCVALYNSFGIDIKEQAFKRQENGKWTSDCCEFSLTHIKGYVAVAVSQLAVGIDIQAVSDIKDVKLLKKISTEEEKNIALTQKDVAILWTKKESIFKEKGKERFKPRQTDTLKENVKTFEPYNGVVLSVCCKDLSNIKFYNVENGELKGIALKEI